jgi:hypothetical protein
MIPALFKHFQRKRFHVITLTDGALQFKAGLFLGDLQSVERKIIPFFNQ